MIVAKDSGVSLNEDRSVFVVFINKQLPTNTSVKSITNLIGPVKIVVDGLVIIQLIIQIFLKSTKKSLWPLIIAL